MTSLQPDPPPSEASLREALRRVIDPEIGMNIIDLGLVYGVVLAEDGSAVTVEMTMTSPACPMGEMIVEDVVSVLREQFPAEAQVEVRLVWEPPWNPKLMSEEARQHYGW